MAEVTRWTDKEKTALVDWLDENYNEDEYGFDLETMLGKDNLSKPDIDKLRDLPGFSSVEARVLPKSRSTAIASLVGEYSSIEDIPTAYREDFQRDHGITDEELKSAFQSKHGESAAKGKIQEQEQRRKDLEEAREWSSEKSTGDNLLATGLKLTPKEADRYYVRHGLDNPVGLSGSALLGGFANLLELAPLPGPLGAGITTLAPAALRTTERWVTGEPGDYDVGKGLSDVGWNAMSFLPVKAIYDVAKGKLGTIGQVAEKNKVAKSRVEQFLTDLDNADQFAKLKAQDEAERSLSRKLDKDMRKTAAKEYLGKPDMDDLANWEMSARQWDNLGRPDIGEHIRTWKIGDTPEIRKEAMDKLETDKQEILLKDRLDYDPTRNKFVQFRRIQRTPESLVQTQKQHAIDKYVASKVPTSTRLVKTAIDNVARPGIRKYKSSDSSLPEMSEKELDSLVRQWEAGFVPRGGLELEYWKSWKEGGRK